MSEYGWINLGNGRQVFRKLDWHEPARSDLPMPRIASDSMAPVQSMLDGLMYDSKSAIRATYKAAGVIEVGNDPARHRQRERPKADRQAIKETIDKARARHARGERA